jgi:hypothetical protein
MAELQRVKEVNSMNQSWGGVVPYFTARPLLTPLTGLEPEAPE